MIYGTGYANSQIYRPRIYGAYILTAGNPPYTISITHGTFYSCAISSGSYYAINVSNGSLYKIEVS